MPVKWLEAHAGGKAGYYVVIDGKPIIGPYPTAADAAQHESGELPVLVDHLISARSRSGP
jgi:hypothetical protein